MYILGIETSCDETSLSLLEFSPKKWSEKNDFLPKIKTINIKSELVLSQISIHQPFGGVVPELGAREHSKNIHFLFLELLLKADIIKNYKEEIFNLKEFWKNLNFIAVTTNPGLPSALKIGLEMAKSLQFFVTNLNLNNNLKIISVNHLYGHLYSSFLNNDSILKDIDIFPHIHLLVSGGNTQIFLLDKPNSLISIANTLDDACGETFDKIGRMLGLDYPAGKTISQISKNNFFNPCNLPISMLGPKMTFSFSGLKTAVRYLVQKQTFNNWYFEKKLTKKELEELLNNDYLKNNNINTKDNQHLQFVQKVAISTQYVVIQQLLNKLKLAIDNYQPKSIGLSGGVSANSQLRQQILNLSISNHFIPPFNLTGDNATMIALAGLVQIYYN